MTKDYTTRSANEAKTLELLDGFEHDEMYSTVQCVKMVFRAQWALAQRVEQIAPLAELLGNWKLAEQDVKKVLALMVRRGVLRSYTRNGGKFYEVNY